MIKTIIFDIGGVITHTDFDATYINFAKRIGISQDFVIGYHLTNIKPLILGQISFGDFCKEMEKVGGDSSLDFKKVWIEEMMKVRTIDQEVLKTIAQLRKNYSVGTLTNLTESRFITDQEIGLYHNFDYSVFSFVEHMEKPDPKFYQIALDRAGVRPEEAVFVDDQEKCTTAAEKMGMKVVKFVSSKQLLTALEDLGVRII